jgi:orotate phosphoribosyltransferase
MNTEQVLKEFEKAGALLRGHFILTSGLRSDVYLQKSLLFTDAKRTTKLIKALAKKVRAEVKTPFTAIVSTAIGGIVPGYEMGRQLNLPAYFVERVEGKFQLRRNFTLTKNQPVLIVDDMSRSRRWSIALAARSRSASSSCRSRPGAPRPGKPTSCRRICATFRL